MNYHETIFKIPYPKYMNQVGSEIIFGLKNFLMIPREN